jgi:hypothetical protein
MWRAGYTLVLSSGGRNVVSRAGFNSVPNEASAAAARACGKGECHDPTSVHGFLALSRHHALRAATINMAPEKTALRTLIFSRRSAVKAA